MSGEPHIIDFKSIAAVALRDATRLIEQWLPGGRWHGDEYSALNPKRADRSAGSFKINRRTGAWAEFAGSDRGRDLISLFAYLFGTTQAEAARELARQVGLGTGNGVTPPVASQVAARTAKLAREKDERSIAAAPRLAGEAEPLRATVGEHYVIAERGIPGPGRGWPACVRFHRRTRALLLVGTSGGGEVRCTHRVHLTPAGRKAAATPTRPTKITNGRRDDAPCRLPGDDPDGVLLLGEGPETALSAWSATGFETWVGFGGLSKIVPPTTRRHVVFLGDDDAAGSDAEKKLRAIVANWRAAGHHCRVAYPWGERRYDKSDFNDLIRAGGAEAVRERINATRFPDGRLPRVTAEQAWGEMDRAISAFVLVEAGLWSPESGRPQPVHALRVAVGGGKSTITRRLLIRLLVQMRARGDTRNILITVPYHRLSAEAAAEFEAEAKRAGADLSAIVFRGRNALDPSGDKPDQRMCLDPDRVADARAAGAPVQTSCCKTTLPSGEELTCPLFAACAYQNQPQTADVIYCAHELLTSALPASFGKIALVVIDEDPTGAFIEGADKAIAFTLDTLDRGDYIPGDIDASDRLHSLRQRTLRALRDMPNGPAPRAKLIEHGMTAVMAREARGLEWRLHVEPKINPAMRTAERKAASAQAAPINSTIRRLSTFWTGIEALLAEGGPERSGWVRLFTDTDKQGDHRMIGLRRRKEICKGARVPTLLTDATLQIDLARLIWPQAERVADIGITAPHQHIRQVTDNTYAMRKLIDDPKRDNDEARRRKKAGRRRLHAIIVREARRTNGRVLAIMQKGLETALAAEFPPLPGNVVTAHHNDVAGRDEWRDVSLLILVGRTSPNPWAVAAAAEALTGHAVDALAEGEHYYPRAPASREMADGSFVPVEVDRHRDQVAEALRWSSCEGGAIQNIGRPRGVNRGPSNPVRIMVLTNVLLPLPVDELIEDDDLDPSPHDLQLAAGGVAFENPSHIAAAYPDYWKRESTARMAVAAWDARFRKTPYREISIRQIAKPRLLRCEFQPAGAGRKPAVAWVDPERVHDPRDRIEELLGARLAWCEYEQPPEGEDVPDQPGVAEQPAQIPAEPQEPRTHVVMSVMAMPIEITAEPTMPRYTGAVVQRAVGSAHAARGPP